MMMLKEKYIQERTRNGKDEYLVFPPSTPRKLLGVYDNLPAALRARNRELGYNPDKLAYGLASSGVRGPGVVVGLSKFGAVGDTHLCDTMERLDVINDLYRQFKEAGIKNVFHTGNLVTGQSTKIQTQVKVWGMDNQADYAAEHYPKIEGITTWGIDAADHEGNWFDKEGVHFGPLLEARRPDYKYIGYVEGNVKFLVEQQVINLRLLHPGKGSAYAISHMGQRHVDGMAPGDPTQLLMVGHFHKADFLPDYKGVAILQTGCAVDVGPWAHRQPLTYTLGGWIVTVAVYEDERPPTFTVKYLGYQPNEWAHNGMGPVLVEG